MKTAPFLLSSQSTPPGQTFIRWKKKRHQICKTQHSKLSKLSHNFIVLGSTLAFIVWNAYLLGFWIFSFWNLVPFSFGEILFQNINQPSTNLFGLKGLSWNIWHNLREHRGTAINKCIFIRDETVTYCFMRRRISRLSNFCLITWNTWPFEFLVRIDALFNSIGRIWEAKKCYLVKISIVILQF